MHGGERRAGGGAGGGGAAPKPHRGRQSAAAVHVQPARCAPCDAVDPRAAFRLRGCVTARTRPLRWQAD